MDLKKNAKVAEISFGSLMTSPSIFRDSDCLRSNKTGARLLESAG